MFNSLWRRFQQWRSLGQRSTCHTSPGQRTILRLEALEDRLTPSTSNFAVSSNSNGSILILTKKGGGEAVLTVTPVAPPASGGWEQFIITNLNGTIGGSSFITTPIVAGLSFVLNSGTDQLTIDGTTAAGVVNLPLGLSITGTGGDKTINAMSTYLTGPTANLTIKLSGSGNENTNLTDVNVGGTAAISHLGSGTTQLQLLTSNNNNFYGSTNGPLNIWNGLTITNHSGSDTNTIQDTDFTGTVNINNGAGAGASGSRNIFSDGNNNALLTVTGGLTIATTSGQSDSEVYDYSVLGALVIKAGNGSANAAPSVIGVANRQTTTGPLPSFGSVALSATAVNRSSVQINVGTGAGDFPLSVNGALNVTGSGSGSYTTKLNDLFVNGTATVSYASSTSNNSLTVQGDQATSTFGSFVVSGTGGGNNTCNFQTTQGTLLISGALNIAPGKGTDTINVGASTGIVQVNGTFTVGSTTKTVSGNKTIVVTGATGASQPTSATFGGVNISLTGSGIENSTFVDTNVVGAATIKHSGSGATTLTIQTTTRNLNLLNNWGSLTVTNGSGTDTNDIFDTNFSGSVAINNGAGGSASTLYGGSQTLIHAVNYKLSLLNIGGSLTITTTSDQSDSEVYDYNVRGALSINTGNGASNMPGANFVGVANNQTTLTNGAPLIGGAVTITGTTVNSLSQGLIIGFGISQNFSGDYPVTLGGNLTVTVGGTGGSNLYFQDVVAQSGTTLFTFGKSTGNQGGNNLHVFGTLITSVYNIFNITSSAQAGANNTVDLQDQAGTMQVLGTMKWTFGGSNDLINMAADNSNDTGVSGAELDLDAFSTTRFSAIQISGKAGLNLLYGSLAYGNTLFYYQPPLTDFVLS